MSYRLLSDHAPYNPHKDQRIADAYATHPQVAYACRRAGEGVSGEGNPGQACGLSRRGATPSVRADSSPLHETRTQNRRSTTNWKTSIDLTRSGVEHAHRAAALLSSLGAL